MESLVSRRLARLPRPLGRRISRDDCGVVSLETLGSVDRGYVHLYSIPAELGLVCDDDDDDTLGGVRRRTVKRVETRLKRVASD